MDIRHNVSLAPYTTFKLGGDATTFITVSDQEEIPEAVSIAERGNLPIYILGGGSNLLVSDTLSPRVIIHIAISYIDIESSDSIAYIRVGAGTLLDDVVNYTVKENFNSFVRLTSIPGTLGGAIVQNAGAYGREISDILKDVYVYDMKDKCYRILSNEDCLFDYRTSIFKDRPDLIILSARFVTITQEPPQEYPDILVWSDNNGKPDTLIKLNKAIREIRANKLPDWKDIGTAGSYFKNPIISREHYNRLKEKFPDLPGHVISGEKFKVPLAWIIDKVCCLKGYRHGTAKVSDRQAVVIISDKGDKVSSPSTTDVRELAEYVINEVYKDTGINVEIEVVQW